jgi:ribosome maturation factor RimP
MMRNKLEQLLEQVIPGLGYEFVNFEFAALKIIRIYIDKPNGVTVDDCEIVSRHLSKLFIVEEIDFNRLEISSPGLERPLKKLSDFTRFKNSLVKIKTLEAINNEKVFVGTIVDVIDAQIFIELDNKQQLNIEFNNINKARLVFKKL